MPSQLIILRPSGIAFLDAIASLNLNSLIELLQFGLTLQQINNGHFTPSNIKSTNDSISTFSSQSPDAITDVVDMEVSSPSSPYSTSSEINCVSSSLTPALNVKSLWDSLVKRINGNRSPDRQQENEQQKDDSSLNSKSYFNLSFLK